MTHLSFMLSRALANGRTGRGAPASREQVLASLLRKRAQAHRLGQDDHEHQLREQIRWALPMRVVREPEAA